MKPFNFILTLPQLDNDAIRKRYSETWLTDAQKAAYEKAKKSGLYLPFTKDIRKERDFYSINTREKVSGIKPLTIQESIAGYFDHQEYKTASPNGIGFLPMRHVTIDRQRFIGKEVSLESLDLWSNGLPEELANELAEMEYTRDEMIAEVASLSKYYLANHGFTLNRAQTFKETHRPSKQEYCIFIPTIYLELKYWQKLQEQLARKINEPGNNRNRVASEIREKTGFQQLTYDKLTRLLTQKEAPETALLQAIQEYLKG
jgi:hypothetical protein